MKITSPLVMSVCVAIVVQFLVGYNTSVMNAPVEVVFPGHSVAYWSAAVSALSLGAPLGSILGGYLPNVYGRKG